MRWIYGDPNDLTKTHILIGRYDLTETYDAEIFLETFKKEHPAYGCQLFLFEGEMMPIVPGQDLYRLFSDTKDLHRVHRNASFCEATDTKLLNIVLGPDGYPPYVEDDDPEVPVIGFDPWSVFSDAMLLEPFTLPELKVPTPPTAGIRTFSESPYIHFKDAEPVVSRHTAPMVMQGRVEFDRRVLIEDAKRQIKAELVKKLMECEECWTFTEYDCHNPNYKGLEGVFRPNNFIDRKI